MSDPLARFYRGKRVLVTGHTGFLGGWTVAWLKFLGAQVCGYGLPPISRPNFFDAVILDRGMTSIFADVRDRNSLANAFSEFQPEIVIHCATWSNPQDEGTEPVEVFSTNVMGTVHLLEEARLTGSVRAMLLVNPEEPVGGGDRGSSGASGQEIHESSINCAEMAAAAFTKCFFTETKTAVATAHVADAIGGGDWREYRLIPQLVQALTNDDPVHLADGQEVQVWHVLEPVHGCLLLAHKLFECGQEFAGAHHLTAGRGCVRPAAEVAEKFVKLWRAQDAEENVDADDANDLEVSQASAGDGNALKALSPERALRWTVEWYRAFDSQAEWARRTTDEQLEKFTRLLRAPIAIESRA